MSAARRVVVEGVGTALLLAAVVGSGIMAQRLAGGDGALALLANTIATAAALAAILLAFGPISGAHLNPVVTLAQAWRGAFAWREVAPYIGAQFAGAVAGVAVANLMFGLPPLTPSHHARSGGGLWLGESVATFGLLAVIFGCARSRAEATPYAVAAYIAGAYWFTSSTSFANPAVTVARSLSDTFAGIRPADIAGFVVAQFVGAVAATALFAWLERAPRATVAPFRTLAEVPRAD